MTKRSVVVAFSAIIVAFLAVGGVLSVRTTEDIDQTVAATIGTGHPSGITANGTKAETTGSGSQAQ